jgi:cation diffusion facilitator family transporter
MHAHSTDRWQHEHSFGQERPQAGERRTLIVLALTAVTMAAEIAAGLAFGSVALLADGLHMGSHAAALAISALAYAFARRHAADPRFAFGTGKVNALAGFSGALLLAAFALAMAWESAARLAAPVPIAFGAAIAVAVLGLAVNIASVLILGVHDHGHGHGDHDHDHDHHHGHDLNLRSAYLHVLADAATSVLAIAALLAGLLLGAWWMDPLMGFVGAALVARWSWGLLRDSARILLDCQAPAPVLEAVRRAIEGVADNRVYDLHVWSVAPGLYAAAIGIVTHAPRPPDDYRALIPPALGLAHVTIEVAACDDAPARAA